MAAQLNHSPGCTAASHFVSCTHKGSVQTLTLQTLDISYFMCSLPPQRLSLSDGQSHLHESHLRHLYCTNKNTQRKIPRFCLLKQIHWLEWGYFDSSEPDLWIIMLSLHVWEWRTLVWSPDGVLTSQNEKWPGQFPHSLINFPHGDSVSSITRPK